MSERPLAAIDLGTNSFHVVVARVGGIEGADGPAGPAFEVIAREKEMVRLGSGGGDMKRLAPDAIDRGVAALDRLARIAAVHDADIHAVATSAVREAENAQEFLDRARAVFTAYRAAVSALRSDPFVGALPRDPEYLSWTLAACAPLPMAERQTLLEADSATARLELVTALLRSELQCMNVIPSLPATEVARTRWSPN